MAYNDLDCPANHIASETFVHTGELSYICQC